MMACANQLLLREGEGKIRIFEWGKRAKARFNEPVDRFEGKGNVEIEMRNV